MGLFTNAKQVMIGNKEVQSIVTSDGGVLYENTNAYELSLTSDKSILSAADNDTAVLTATLTNNNVPVSGETCIFTSDKSFESILCDSRSIKSVGDYAIIDVSNLNEYDHDLSHDYYVDGTFGVNNSGFSIRKLTNGFSLDFLFAPSGELGGPSYNFTNPQIIIKNGIITLFNGNEEIIIDRFANNNLQVHMTYDNIAGSVTIYNYFYATAVTDSSGEASVSYVSKGTGDLNIKVECMNQSEIYSLEDCLKVISSQTVTVTSTGVVFTKLYGLSSEMPVEVTANIASSKPIKFGLVLKEGDNQTNNQYIRAGAEGTYKGATITSTQYTHTTDTTSTATANTSFPVKITYDGTDITGYVDGNSVISHSKTFSPLYVMILHWTESNRTVTVSNLKVKPL